MLYLPFKNTTDSGTRPTNFKYINFGTTYHRSTHFSTLPYYRSVLFHERLIISNAIKEKYKRTKRYSSTVYRKYPSLAKIRGNQCSSPDIADHPSDTPRLLLSPSVPGLAIFSGMMEKHTTIESRKAGNVQRTKPKNNVQADIGQKINIVIFGATPVELLALLG